MSIIIRYATNHDAEIIADISRKTFYESFAAQNTKEDMEKFMAEQFTKKALMAEVDTPENTFLLAYTNNELAGYVRLRDGNSPSLLKDVPAIQIARIYATSAMIGKGVGKTLMEASINIAKAKNKKVVWLGVWEKNERAIQFYTNFGFHKFDEHNFILGNDIQRDWLMKKDL